MYSIIRILILILKSEVVGAVLCELLEKMTRAASQTLLILHVVGSISPFNRAIPFKIVWGKSLYFRDSQTIFLEFRDPCKYIGVYTPKFP